jgi:hypothetical protein
VARAHRRDRKKQLLIYGIATAVVATATIGTIAVASPGLFDSSADAKAAPETSLQAEFEEAAREFDVPKSVLMAVSYRQTRWEDHNGLPSTSGAYNVMGLTQVTPEDLEEHSDEEHLAHLNRSGDPAVTKKFNRALALKAVRDEVDTTDPRLHTLEEAAELIDKSADAVQNDPEQSIRAGAALLAEYQRDATGSLSDDPGKWYPAVARFSQAPDAKGADLFAKRVYESIKTGERALTTDGQQITLPADLGHPRQAVETSARRVVRVDFRGSDARVPGRPELQFRRGRLRPGPGQLQHCQPSGERLRHP